MVDLEADACRQLGGDVAIVLFLAAGVDHQHQRAVAFGAGRPRHHQVVENAAVVGEELGIALLAGFEVEDVRRQQRLDRTRRRRVIGAVQPAQAHVADVEEAGLLARPQVLLEHAERILHGHVVAGERHHLGAGRDVGVMEGSAPEWRTGSRIGAHVTRSHAALKPGATIRTSSEPPLSLNLRDSDLPPINPGERPYPFGEPALPPAAFQSVINLRSLVPERFRGGCSFGAVARPGRATRRSLPQISTDGHEDRPPDRPVNRRA